MQLSPLIRFSLPLIVTGSSEQQIIILPQTCDITLTKGMRHLRGPMVQMIVIELQIIAVDKIRTGSRTNTWYNLYMNFIIKYYSICRCSYWVNNDRCGYLFVIIVIVFEKIIRHNHLSKRISSPMEFISKTPSLSI